MRMKLKKPKQFLMLLMHFLNICMTILIANDVIGYYKIQPTTIKYVDFYVKNNLNGWKFLKIKLDYLKVKNNILNTLKYWITVVELPFLTATIAPIMLFCHCI